MSGISKILNETELSAVLIVPEQQTVVWETRIAELLPENQYLRVEVTNFTRLANSVFREYGGLAAERCDDGGRALILWRAMLSVWDGLAVYNRGIDGREDKNLPALMAAVGEMKQNGVSPLNLETAAYNLEKLEGESELTKRLYDLSLVYSAYDELLHEEYCDKYDVMNALCEKLEGEGRGYFENKACFVDSFFSLTMPQKRIMRSIMTHAAETTVTFSCDTADSGEIQFGEVKAYFDSMVQLANDVLGAENSADLVIKRLKKDLRHSEDSRLYLVEKELFGFYSINKDEVCADDGSVRVIKCADKYEEAEMCAAAIEKLVREGYRYSDIAVVSRNISARAGIVDTALRRHGIPCFISERSALAEAPAVRLITSLLDIQSNGWLRRDVIRMIKTGLTPLKDYECDLLEEYTAAWNIRGRKLFTMEGGWNMNPDGYRKELSPWGKETLLIVNQAREKLFPAVERFCELFDEREGIEAGNAPVREICTGIVNFAVEIGMYGAVNRAADELEASGYMREAAQNRQVWGAICGVLDKLVMILGDTPVDSGRFCGLFTYVCSSMDIGTIPTAVDEVVLGSSDGVRFSEIEHMIILGSVEGEFPGTADDLGFFCDADKLKLSVVGINLSNDTSLRTAQEYFMYYRTACIAKKSLTILVPVSEGEMSQGAARLCSVFGDEIVKSYGGIPLAERMYSPVSADYAISYESGAERELLAELSRKRAHNLAKDVSEQGETEVGIAVTDERIKHETLDKLFGRRMNLSQSRIDSYVNCPFAYWCRYVMKLKESAHAEITLPDIGVFIHEVLEKFFSETKGREYPLSGEETERIADEIIGGYMAAFGDLSGRLSYLFMRLKRNVICFIESIMEELSESEFKPIAFELPIGISAGTESDSGDDKSGAAVLEPISFKLEDGSEVVLRGIADRVDLYKNEGDGKSYIRVIDYKTGSKTFSLDDIRLGLNVQLLVYLFSIWKGNHTALTGEKEVYPAGAVYFSARPGEVSSGRMLSGEEAKELIKSHIVRSGLFLADDTVLDAMDRSGKYIPVKLRGGKSAAARNFMTMEEFGKLYSELEGTIVRICGEIRSGNAEASPLIRAGRSPCDYCAHYPICRHSASGSR